MVTTVIKKLIPDWTCTDSGKHFYKKKFFLRLTVLVKLGKQLQDRREKRKKIKSLLFREEGSFPKHDLEFYIR